MAKKAAEPTVEELHFRSDSAFLCLLLNHRTKFIRVIDFRAGALPAKRLFIQSVAKQHGVQKVITLVERDEVSSWTRVGFVREGTIPGFYKRSDGHLCGCVIGDRTASVEISDDGSKVAEKTVAFARKAAKDIPETIKGASVKEIDPEDVNSARDQAWKKGIAINSFDNFGRDAERMYMSCGLKKAKTNVLGAEYQDCFGHSLIEVLRSPSSQDELLALVAGLREMNEALKERGIISAFAFAPSDNTDLATAFAAAGFRKTGLLAQALQVGDDRKDAILWSNKLANPSDDDI